MRSKRQQTMAKMTRERLVKERRALKLEKKQAAADERKSRSAENELGGGTVAPQHAAGADPSR